jgi:PEP-CTERM motif
MRPNRTWYICLFFAALTCISTSSVARAVVIGVSASNVDAYFGSQNDAYQNSNPTAGAWSPIGPGPYAGPALPAGVPAAPAGNVAPSNVTPFGGSPSSSSFNDTAGNLANSAIVAFVGGPNSLMDDAQIALTMSLNQTAPASGPSYAYEQLNYSADFALLNTVNTAGVLNGVVGSNVTRSFSVSGSVAAWVEFGGIMNFWDVPTAGSPTLLGSLVFSYNNASPGAFATVVSSSGFIGGPAINSPDSIRITGDFFVAGDPSSITVESLPEPSSLVLACLGVVGFVTIARRRKR